MNTNDKIHFTLLAGTLLIWYVLMIGPFLIRSHKSVPAESEREEIQPEPAYQALDENEILLMALMWTESRFNPEASDGQGSEGILQIRQTYVDEVNRILSKEVYKLEDARNLEKSLEMFEILQNYHNPDRDFIQTIYYHNKSTSYRNRVIKNYNMFLAYEKMREKIHGLK